MDMTTFNYFYEGQEDQYAFFRIPKKLMTEPCFKKLILEGKVLYGLMLDRLSLSRKNHWVDDEGRLYIIYTVEQIMEDLNCSRPSAMNALNALDDKKGIGLIRRVRRGLGLPNIIYVMDFMTSGGETVPADHSDETPSAPKDDVPNFQKLKNLTSGSKENELQEVKNFNSNKTNKSKTKENKVVVHPPAADHDNDSDYDEIIEVWNACEGAMPIQGIGRGTQREQTLKKCIRQFGRDTFFDTIRKIPKSEYLRNTGTKFNWFIEPDNFTKVLEGAYDRSYAKKGKPANAFHNFDQRTYTEDELELLFERPRPSGRGD